MLYCFLAPGFEETEAIAPIDMLRRAKIDVKTVGVGAKQITGSHGIPFICDLTDDEIVLDDAVDGVILPGGMPGTLNLENSDSVQRTLDYCHDNGKLLCAICAAPSVLGHKEMTLKAQCSAKRALPWTAISSQPKAPALRWTSALPLLPHSKISRQRTPSALRFSAHDAGTDT